MKKLSGTTVNAFFSGMSNGGQILACYTGAVQVYTYTGPHNFYRAAGLNASGRLGRAYGGEWWADESVLIEIAQKLQRAEYWMTQSERQKAWPAQYRALTALCEDWNDMSEMFKLELPAGESIEGLAGPAKEQPEFSATAPHGLHNPNRILIGGAEQVFFKVKNPLWIQKVQLW